MLIDEKGLNHTTKSGTFIFSLFKRIRELESEHRAHPAVNAHVERGVDRQQEVADVDGDKGPRGEGIHPVGLTVVICWQGHDLVNVWK